MTAMPPPAAKKLTVKLHREQARFCYSTALYRACHAGIGGGKSWVIAFDLFSRAKPGRTYMLVAPTYRQLVRSTLKSVQRLNETIPLIKKFHKAAMSIELWNGAEILLASGDNPDSLRGPNLSGAALDEASLMDEEVYDISIGRLREAGEQGWLSACFTPKGQSHWTFKRFGQEQPDTEVFTWKTGDNPFNPATFASTLQKQYVGRFADQELGGAFVSAEGCEWPAEYFGPHIWVDHFPPRHEILLTTIALDPSKGRGDKAGTEDRAGDYSCFTVAMLHRDGTVYVLADMDQRRNAVEIVRDGIRLIQQYAPISAFAVEVNSWQELLAAEFLRVADTIQPRLHIPLFKISNQIPKDVRIRRLGPLLAGVDGRFRFIAKNRGTELLVQQLRDFRGPPAPPHLYYDGPDSLEMNMRMIHHLLSGPAASVGKGSAPVPMGRA